MARSKKTIVWVVVGVGIVALLALPKLLGGDETGPPASGPSQGGPLVVTASPVRAALVEDRIQTTGTLLPEEAVDLRAEIGGRVTAIRFQEGGYVRRGQLLVALDAQVLEAEVQAARSRRELAGVQAERMQALFDIGGTSRQALDQAQSEVRVLDAELARLRAEIERRRIYAPFSGEVGLREVSVGAYVSPGDRLATLRVTNPLKLEFSVPERYLGRLQNGDAVVFTVPGQDETYRASVYATEPAVDPNTRAFTVRARVPNPGAVLRPGTFAEVDLVFDRIETALLVPTVALVPGADSASVYLIRGGQVQPQTVGTGVRTADQIQITSGVAAGDTVLTSSFDEVRPGQAVRVAGGGFDPTAPAPEVPEPQGAYRTVPASD